VRNSQGLLQKARNYAFLLLKFRLRSEKELYERLKKKKFPEETIRGVISSLKDKGFIDDRIFAKAWIASRLKKPLGLRRVKQELKLKGVDKEIVESLVNEITKDYSEADKVLEITEARLDRLKGIEPRIAKRRIYAYLLRRGFSHEVIMDVVSKF